MDQFDLSSYFEDMTVIRRDLFQVAIGLQRDGGTCIGIGQMVQVEESGEISMRKIEDLKVGDKVLTTSGFSNYLGEFHSSVQNATLTFHFGSGEHLQVTEDHLVGSNTGYFLPAKQYAIGSYIGSRIVERITHEQEVWTCCPLTQSGTIIVNGAPVSCFACVDHWLAKVVLMPLTHFGFYLKDIPGYVDILVKLHSSLPQFVRQFLPIYL